MKARKSTSAIKQQVDELKWKAVVDTAIDLFYENGYAGTSIDMIAAQLGVTKPFIYYRFESKADLLTEVFAQAEERVGRKTQDILASSLRPEQKYRAIAEEFAETACSHWKMLAVFYTEERHLPERKLAHHRRIRAEWERNIRGLLEQGKKAGVFEFGDVAITLNALMGMVIWAYSWVGQVPEEEHPKVVSEMTDLALALVRCKGA